MPSSASLKIAVVDDHKLFRKGLINLVEMVNRDCHTLFEADNGLEMQRKLDRANLPDIIIMDINMPVLDGFSSVQWLKENYPQIKILVVSMVEKEETVVKMLRLGVSGYLCKDVEPVELGNALKAIAEKGFYYTDFVTGKLVHALQLDPAKSAMAEAAIAMTDREKEFLKLACSDLTYQEIADKMFLSPKTIDGYRNSLFEKFNVKSRVALALYAVKHGIISL